MCSPKAAFILHLLSFAVLLKTVLGDNQVQLAHKCSGVKFRVNGHFPSNLQELIASLSKSTPPVGFARDSIGEESDQVHGLGLCRGDVNQLECKTCIQKAAQEIYNLCHSKKAGVVWYDHCMLKYSNEDFLSKVDMQNKFHVCDEGYSKVSIRKAKKKIFQQLVESAYLDPKLYAKADTQEGMTPGSKLYGMVQCTGDLSGPNCKKCLKTANQRFETNCGHRKNGMFYTGSCYIRYETNHTI
ncbi:hypothetical protein K2173_018812 [Erythroxylum novogranatense]|uniref:Gnk2-homologous domain-containing protein n=1 Tax=Erythroxylum novogranatense TaxID=1862640 RepID=A0AAV8SBB3_9ROSI|nr:hypothetical protein K2173_018812 [Erythroxylum novogranatense]